MRRIILVCCLLLLVMAGACRYLLPERFAVNAPMMHTLLGGRGAGTPDARVVGDRMQVAQGFEVGLWATNVRGARGLRFTPAGDLLVTRPRAGEVVLLEADRDGDGRSNGQRVLLQDLNRPHGMDFYENWLYIAETDGFGRVPFEAGDGSAGGLGQLTGPYERLVGNLPADGNHWSRTLRLGPDGRIYVSVGSSCNVCLEDEPERRAALLSFEPDGGGEKTVATGLRNTVGFDWRPSTGELFGTDNGRDLLGDDFPPCELNRIEAGGFYGWPHANGDLVPDPEFGEGQRERIAMSIAPAHAFGAHNAPLGIAFVSDLGSLTHSGDVAIVALHGSWNRREKDGYKVVSLRWEPDGSIVEHDFLTGFLEGNDVIGRPVDVLQGPDGAIYISDDYANVIWRVSRMGQGSASPGTATLMAVDSMAADALAGLAAADIARLEAQGGELYATHDCATCHEAEAAGEGVVVKPLIDLSARYDIDDLTALLRTPPSPMPIPELDDEGRNALAVFLLVHEQQATPKP